MVGGAIRAGKAYVELVLYDKELRRGLAMVQVNMRRFGQQLSAIGRTAAAFSVPIVAGLATTVKAASDTEEYLNRFRVIFGDLTSEAEVFSESLAKSIGRSAIQIKNSMAGLQSFFEGLKFSPREAMKMSQEMTKLTYDLASFNNIADEEAAEKMLSAMSGEIKPLREFGISLTEAAVAEQLVKDGFEGVSTSATMAQKAIARLNIIRDVLGRQGAVGDAARTIGSFANQLKVLAASTYEARARIGQLLIPELVKLVGWLADAADGVKAWADRNKELGKTLTDLAGKVAVFAAGAWTLGKAIQLLPALIALVTSGGWVTASVVGVGVITAAFLDWDAAVDSVKDTLGGIGELIQQGRWEDAGRLAGLAFKKGIISGIKGSFEEIEKNNSRLLSFAQGIGFSAPGFGVAGKRFQKASQRLDESIRKLKEPVAMPSGEPQDPEKMFEHFGPKYWAKFWHDPLGTSGWMEEFQEARKLAEGFNGVVVALGNKLRRLPEALSGFKTQWKLLDNPLPGSTWGKALSNMRMMWINITEEARRYREEVAKATDIFERTRTPVEQAKAEIEKINESFEKGFINQETRDRAIDLIKEDLTSQLQLPEISKLNRGALVGGQRASQIFDKATTQEKTMTALAKRQLEQLIKLNRQAAQSGLLFQ